jgi:hypothetical protein
MSYVFGLTHKFRQDGKIVPMPREEREDAENTCKKMGEQACNAILVAAAAAATAVIAALLVDLGRQGGGTRKAKKSNRKRRATRRI